jgi:phage host-nuclease inhibitor protein Gam
MSSIKVDLAARLDAAETWAGENAAEFAGKKSIVMVHGTVGYRTGKPRLKTLRGWTWDRVLGVLETAFPEYVRVKKTVDKERLLADQDKLGPDRMRRVGCTTVQDETFFVEPHRESSEEAA